MKKKLVLFGCGETAEVMYEYFKYDSEYEIVGFSVNREYIKSPTLNDLPIVPLEEVHKIFVPSGHSFFAAISYTRLNRVRTNMYQTGKMLGYAPASYISTRANIMPNAKIGEHVFIFEDNVIQPFVTIGNNVILWSGNHIGHRAVIHDNCFISSHVVVSGYAVVGANSFLGVNSSIADYVSVGEDCFIGAGSVISLKMSENSITKPQPCKVVEGARIFSGLKECER